MNRRLLGGVVAGATAIALTAGGVTYAAFSDSADITGNSVGAGILQLQLVDGSGQLSINFAGMAPDGPTRRAIWLASSAQDSTPDANLSMTVHNVVDTKAACSVSLGKALAEQRIGNGCTVHNNAASGTPTSGLLSQVLTVGAGYYPGVTTSTACQAAAASAPTGTIWSGAQGSLHALPSGGSTFSIGSPALVVQPGNGVCIAISAQWPMNGSGPSDVDDAAQGDSVSFDVRFDLTQVS